MKTSWSGAKGITANAVDPSTRAPAQTKRRSWWNVCQSPLLPGATRHTTFSTTPTTVGGYDLVPTGNPERRGLCPPAGGAAGAQGGRVSAIGRAHEPSVLCTRAC